MEYPEELRPVLARIVLLTDLGFTSWHEVVFHDGQSWRSFFGSRTFEDGEQVRKWVYVSDVMPE